MTLRPYWGGALMRIGFGVLAVLASQLLSSTNVLAQDAATSTTAVISAPIQTAEPLSPIKFKGLLDVLEIGRKFDDKYFQSTNSLTVVTPRFDAYYNSWLSFDLEVSGIFVAGNTKNLYTTEGKGTDIVILDEVAINIKPTKELEFRAGALGTKINPILSIMSENCFIGTIQKYTFLSASEDLKLTATAEEAVPAAGTVTPGLINEAPNAYFVTGTLAADLAISSMNSKIRFASTGFQFGNLSSNVASDSRFIGNSPRSFDGIGDLSRYTIGFGGFETAVAFKTDWTKTLSTEFVGSTIINQQAPSDRNNGAQAFINVKKKFQTFNIIPSFGMFNMAADVTPAAYTILPNRFHNRKGFTAEVDVQLEKQKLVFFASYTNADVLSDSIYLADRKMYNLGMEAKYDFL